jgi:hypothetical protein
VRETKATARQRTAPRLCGSFMPQRRRRGRIECPR